MQHIANNIANADTPRASLKKKNVRKEAAHAVLIIKLISYPKTRQFRPAIIP